MFDDVGERQNWLRNLNIGDEITFHRYGLGERTYRIGVITHITPSRNRFEVCVDGLNYKFNRNGYSTGGVIGMSIMPVTQEVLNANRFAKIRHEFESILTNGKFSKLRDDVTLDQMERIIAIMKEGL